MQRVLGADQIAHADADLPERGQRHRQAVARAVGFVQRDAPLRQRERLLVAVLHHHHVRLVAADRGEDVVGVHQRGKALGLAQRAHRLVVPAQLGERDSRERMDQREVAAIARRVQRRRGLRDVLADDGDVRHLAIAQAELVVGEADAARVVGGFRVLQRPRLQGDCA